MRSGRRAFTLLELLLVLLIVAVTLAMAAPSLRGWNRGAQLNNAAEQLVATARYGQMQALTTARMYRMEMDLTGGRYWLQVREGREFVPLHSEFGRVFHVPEGFVMSVGDDARRSAHHVEFHPNGRTTPVVVRIVAPNGEWIEVGCETAAEQWGILSINGEGPR